MSRAPSPTPPRLALRFLSWFCPPDLHESIEGDLVEQFDDEVKAFGISPARRRFVFNTLKFFRPGIFLRNRFSFDSINLAMLQSYFTMTFRNILKNKGYSFINIFGLSLGIAVCLLTFNYVKFETTFDSSHPDVDRMYRVNQTNIWDPAGGVFNSTGPAVAFALKSDYPEIEEILRVNTPGGLTVRYPGAEGTALAFNEDKILAADSNFFSFFDFKLKEGDPRTALVGKGHVVISSQAAEKLFGDEPALGKIIEMGDERTPVEITGVTEEQPDNIHFHFDYLLSMYSNPAIKNFEWSWIWTQVVTYVKVRPGTDVAALDNKLKGLADRHAPATFKKIGMDYNEFIKEKGKWYLYLQPVKDIWLHSSKIGNRLGPVGDVKYVYILSMVAIFILLIAVINFVNLSTARGATRAKEVGVKKTLGLMRSSLIAQFQVEHILITIISVLLGIPLMEVLRSLIRPLVGIDIPSPWDPTFITFVLVFPLVIGVIAGLYPSFYLTKFNPSQVLKGKIASGMRSSGLRNGLVVFQFTISIGLMAATAIVFQQLDFFRTQSVGFDKDHLLIIDNVEKLGNQQEAFRDEISRYPGVTNITLSMDIRNGFEDIYMREGDDMKLTISQYKVDEHFFETTKLPLATGRYFDVNRPSDARAVIINETTARLFGWKNEEAIGEKIIYVGDDVGPSEIIGVAKDFHFQSLHQNIMPFMFYNINSKMWGDERILLVRYNTSDVPDLISRIENKWGDMVNDIPFVSAFYDQELKMQYQQEERLGSLFSIFSGLSVAIAIVGLIGLVAYSAEIRKKEIGIRKVFGASTSRIIVMMNKQYMKLILISMVIACPLTWWAMKEWLDSFAYKIDISPMVFIIVGIAELLLAVACVVYLSTRAASANPASVLKEE